jgi:hypothetical protein
MPDAEREPIQSSDSEELKGTTLAVYRFLFRKSVPMGVRDVQQGLSLSSPSLAHYHLQKLLAAGLIQELPSGYIVNRTLYGGLVRIKTMVIPVQTALVVFFSSAIVLMLTILRPPAFFSGYTFGLVVIVVALIVAVSQVIRILHEP